MKSMQMTKEQLKEYLESLDPNIARMHREAWEYTNASEDVLEDEWQIAAEIEEVFLKYAERRVFNIGPFTPPTLFYALTQKGARIVVSASGAIEAREKIEELLPCEVRGLDPGDKIKELCVAGDAFILPGCGVIRQKGGESRATKSLA